MPGPETATLEMLIVCAELQCTAAELAAQMDVDAAVLRRLFDRSARAKAAALGTPDAALAMLAKLWQKAARATKRETKLAEAAAEAEARNRDPEAQELDQLFTGLDDPLGVLDDELAILDDMEFAQDEEARALGLPWAPPAPGYRHPRYVPPPPKPKCGAKTRKGEPCVRTAMPNGRCRNHGGLSTGPKTEEGRRRCIEAPKRYYAARRASVGTLPGVRA